MRTTGITEAKCPKAGDSKADVIKRDTVNDDYCRVERPHRCHRLFAGGMSAGIERDVMRRGHAVAGSSERPPENAAPQ